LTLFLLILSSVDDLGKPQLVARLDYELELAGLMDVFGA
jgi:hypothetical protein